MRRALLALAVVLASAVLPLATAAPAWTASTPAVTSVVAVRPVPGELAQAFRPPPGPYAAGHRGVDLAAAPGDPVRSALPGTVTFAGPVARVGWVTVRHDERLDTTYGPIDEPVVRPGQRVTAGQVLGPLADSANYLDWGARLDGRYIDPLSLLAPWEVHLIAW